MAKKKNSEKFNINKNLTSIILFAFLSLTYLSILTDSMGLIGHSLKNFSFKLFGIGSYIIYPLLMGNLLLVLLEKINPKNTRSIVLAYITMLLFLVVIDINTPGPINFNEKISYTNKLSSAFIGPGLLAATLSYGLNLLIGKLGIYILFVISIFFMVLSIINLSVKDFFKVVAKSLKEFFRYIYVRYKKYKNNQLKKKKAKARTKTKLNNNIKNPNLKKESSNTTYKETKETEDIIDIPSETIEDGTFVISNYNDEEKQLSVEDYDLKIKETPNYSFPPLELLRNQPQSETSEDTDIIRENAEIIEDTLESFNISGKVVQVNRGPRVTSYELQPAGGVKVSSIVNLQDNLALSLATSGIRIEAPIPGKAAVGIEVPNKSEDTVTLKDIISSSEYTNSKYKIPFALGKDIAGDSIVTGIEKMPHLLIAGATGSGKSVCINTLITSILFNQSPDDVKMVLIDPKMVELSIYNGIPHLVIPVVTDPKKASAALNWAVREMERRYELFSQKSVRDITSYKENCNDEEDEKLPYIVIVIDELSDLMMVAAGEVEDHISRLAQMSRACGIHLVIATQRPSVDVITGTIKANIPSRISFAVSSQVDSRTILDMAGAEKLLGKGDMLFFPSNFMKPIRVQGAFVTDSEVENLVSYIKEHSDQDYDQSVIEDIKKQKIEKQQIDSQDELLSEAIDIVIREEQASVSQIQRKLQVGYARAGRIIDQMEALGVIEGHQGSKPRKVLVSTNILEAGENDEYSE